MSSLPGGRVSEETGLSRRSCPAQGISPFPSPSLPFLICQMGSMMLILRFKIKRRIKEARWTHRIGKLCCAHMRSLGMWGWGAERSSSGPSSVTQQLGQVSPRSLLIHQPVLQVFTKCPHHARGKDAMVSKARPQPSAASSEMGHLLNGPGVSLASPEPSTQNDSLRPS